MALKTLVTGAVALIALGCSDVPSDGVTVPAFESGVPPFPESNRPADTASPQGDSTADVPSAPAETNGMGAAAPSNPTPNEEANANLPIAPSTADDGAATGSGAAPPTP